MSLHTLAKDVDRGTHKEALAKQRQSMDAIAAKMQAAASADKKSLHLAGHRFRGPEDEPVSTLAYFAGMAEQHGIGPDREQLKDAENYWLKRLHVRATERVREEKVKEYARQRWALETVMADHGIRVRGPMCSTVQKAFNSSTVQVIFPFFYDAMIQAGLLANSVLDRLIFEDVPVNSHSADHAQMTDAAGDRSWTEGGEGVKATEVIIRATNHPILLHKYLGKARISYEAARLQRIPVFERGLMRVAQQFAIQITDSGVETLVAGDGQSGAAATQATTTAGSPVYDDILKIHLDKFGQGYMDEDRIWLMSVAPLRKTLGMTEFKDPFAGFRYQSEGTMVTPLGQEIVRWDVSGNATSWDATKIMELIPDLAMVKYTEGGLITETDKIIDGQWEDTVFSTWTGFGIFDRAACVVGTGW